MTDTKAVSKKASSTHSCGPTHLCVFWQMPTAALSGVILISVYMIYLTVSAYAQRCNHRPTTIALGLIRSLPPKAGGSTATAVTFSTLVVTSAVLCR